jgi:hypothetical protein
MDKLKQFTIKNTLYDIDEKYFEQLLIQLDEYLCERYQDEDIISPLELMSQIAYIKDLTLHQKMYFSLWIGMNNKNLKYEELILQCLNKNHTD